MVDMTTGYTVDRQAYGWRRMVRMVMIGTVCVVGLVRFLQAHALETVARESRLLLMLDEDSCSGL